MFFNKNKIRLFWWNEVVIQGKSKENYGDLLGKYLVEKISGKDVVFIRPNKFSIQDWFAPIYVTVGSILTHVNKKCIVWGSGIISKVYKIKPAKFLAVRGPQTRKHLIAQGFEVPEIYGDPGLLLPRFYNPEVEKQYSIGIVPHYNDYKTVHANYGKIFGVQVIDLMTNDIEKTTRDLLACERIISSSLHGIIVAHAYGIPAVWQKFSDKVFGDDIKYQDYFESVHIKPYKSDLNTTLMPVEELALLFNTYESLPDANQIRCICDKLMAVCPFKS